MAHTIDCVCSKIIKSCFKSWVIILTFQDFRVEKHFELTWKFRSKIWIPILFNISVLLDVQANLPVSSPFFVCPIGFGELLFSNVYSTYLGCITLAQKQICPNMA